MKTLHPFQLKGVYTSGGAAILALIDSKKSLSKRVKATLGIRLMDRLRLKVCFPAVSREHNSRAVGAARR